MWCQLANQILAFRHTKRFDSETFFIKNLFIYYDSILRTFWGFLQVLQTFTSHSEPWWILIQWKGLCRPSPLPDHVHSFCFILLYNFEFLTAIFLFTCWRLRLISKYVWGNRFPDYYSDSISPDTSVMPVTQRCEHDVRGLEHPGIHCLHQDSVWMFPLCSESGKVCVSLTGSPLLPRSVLCSLSVHPALKMNKGRTWITATHRREVRQDRGIQGGGRGRGRERILWQRRKNKSQDGGEVVVVGGLFSMLALCCENVPIFHPMVKCLGAVTSIWFSLPPFLSVVFRTLSSYHQIFIASNFH